MSQLIEIADRYKPSVGRQVARGVMICLGILAVWAFLARLDEVTMAEGEVVPEGKVKVIQHLEGGIIQKIFVQEGEVVKEGDSLMQLELAIGGVNKAEMQVRIDGLVLTRARLTAEANGTDLVFPTEESKRQPRLVAAEQQNYEIRRQSHESTIAVLTEQVRQKVLEVQELQARQRSAASNLRLMRGKLAMSQDLLNSGLTSKMEHIQMETEVQVLTGEIDTLRSSLPRAEAALAEARERIREETLSYSRSAQQELPDVEVNIARHRELLSRATDQQVRTLVLSPIHGIVKNMRTNTIGGVIKPGEAMMEIVPLEDRLQIEARLNPADRGYVVVGQKAVVKISAYDFTRYGGLDGIVVMVAPDTTTMPEQQPFYRVVVQTDKSYLGEADGIYPITPGMQAVVDIHTGTRSVMDYLIKPVLKLKHEAFREP